MKIGTKVVLMRDKRYGLFQGGRYEQVRIATLENIVHASPSTEYHFSTRLGPIVMTEANHTKRWPEGWHPVYVDPQLPADDELAEKLMSAIDAIRRPALIHVGGQFGEQAVGTIITSDPTDRFGEYRIYTQTVLLDNLNAKAGDLVVGQIHHASENEVGQPRFFVKEQVVIAQDMHLDRVFETNWPVSKLLSTHDLEEHHNRLTLGKQEDMVLFYADGNDVLVITSSGLRAHESSDLSADAWHWGNGEPEGFYVARDLSWAGSGEDIELEADVEPVNDEEVARILHDTGFGSSELVDHDLDDNTVMRIAAHLGDEAEAQARMAERAAKAAEQRAAA